MRLSRPWPATVSAACIAAIHTARTSNTSGPSHNTRIACFVGQPCCSVASNADGSRESSFLSQTTHPFYSTQQWTIRGTIWISIQPPGISSPDLTQLPTIGQIAARKRLMRCNWTGGKLLPQATRKRIDGWWRWWKEHCSKPLQIHKRSSLPSASRTSTACWVGVSWGTGRNMAPFNSLRQQHPAIWKACEQTLEQVC